MVPPIEIWERSKLGIGGIFTPGILLSSCRITLSPNNDRQVALLVISNLKMVSPCANLTDVRLRENQDYSNEDSQNTVLTENKEHKKYVQCGRVTPLIVCHFNVTYVPRSYHTMPLVGAWVHLISLTVKLFWSDYPRTRSWLITNND